MRKCMGDNRNNGGSVSVVALIMLMVLTLLGIAASRSATTDMRIAANEIPFKQDFFIAEGGAVREAMEVGRGNYAPRPHLGPYLLATEAGQSNGADLPDPNPHTIQGAPYVFELRYMGSFLPSRLYSSTDIARYDFVVENVEVEEAGRRHVKVSSRFFRIGTTQQGNL